MNIGSKSNIFQKSYVYIEAICYGILVIVTVFASYYGPIYIKMLPLVFILGIVGRIVFDRPVVTSLFGLSISLCIFEIIGNSELKYNFIYSMYNFFCIILGEIAGACIHNIYTSKNKKLTKKLAQNISLIALTTFLGLFLNKYLNGDYIGYIKARNLLYDYARENYPLKGENMKIVKSNYVYGTLNYYSFTVKNLVSNNDKIYNIGVYSNNKVVDGYYDTSIISMTSSLRQKFNFKYGHINEENLKLDVYYQDLGNNIVLSIEKNVDKIDEKSIEEFALEIDDILQEVKSFDEFEKIYKVNAVIKNKLNAAISDIYKEEFFDIEKYIKGFKYEYFEM